MSAKKRSNLLWFILTLLAIEFLDEFVDGVKDAALPLIRDDLELTYTQVGILLSIPAIISNIIEPIFYIWADTGQRRNLVLGGGVALALGLGLVALSHNFLLLLVAFSLYYAATGLFVNLSQATLMDAQPTRHEQNMARWALAGSVGNVVGPLAVGGIFVLQQSWRSLYFVLMTLTLLLVGVVWPFPISTPAVSPTDANVALHFQDALLNAISALKRCEVLRWLILIEFSNLMLDVLRGFLTLYFVDVVGVNQTQASFALTVWLGVGLLGDVLLIPLLEHIRGLSYLRCSAIFVFSLYPALLLIPQLEVKLVILGCLGLLNSGWYSILQGQIYTAMPGQSGTVVAIGTVFNSLASLIPFGLGIVAQHYGLQTTMWLFLVSPVVLLLGIPSKS